MALAREVLQLEDLLGVERAVTECPQYKAAPLRGRWEAIEQGNLLAHKERQRLELGEAPVSDLGDLLEAQGIVTLELELPDNLSGFTIQLRREQGVACGVNIMHSPERRRFSLAHEYCHVLMDHDLPGIVSRREEEDELREVRANAFAAAFLMPEDGIRDYLSRLRKGLPSRPREAVVSPEGRARLVEGRLPPRAGEIGIWHVCLLASHFGVSRRAMIWRLYNLDLVNEGDKDRLLAAEEDGSARTLARLLAAEGGEATEEVPGESGAPHFRLARRRMVHLALEAFRRELISRRKCLELMSLAGASQEEAQKLVERVAAEIEDA